MNTQEPITNSSLIKGILREVSILRVPAHFEVGSERYLTSIDLGSDKGRVITGTEVVNLSSIPCGITNGTLIFELDGLLFRAELKSTPEGGFSMPLRLDIVHRRQSSRISSDLLSDNPLLAEVSLQTRRYYGTLRDLNAEAIVVTLQGPECRLEVGESASIALYENNQQRMLTQGRVTFIRKPADGCLEVVFQLANPRIDRQDSGLVSRAQRSKIKKLAVISLAWPKETALKFNIGIQDVGTFGFAGEIESPSGQFPPIGAVCQVLHHQMRARIVWKDESSAGFDLRLNERRELVHWHDLVENWTRTSLLNLPESQQTRRMISIMLRSGYLKGKRAEPFQSDAKLRALIPNSEETRQWLHRISGAKEGNLADHHISYLKLTDYSWIIQEFGQCSQLKNLGESLIIDSMREFYRLEAPYFHPASVLIALYDPQSKFNQKFWNTRSSKPYVYFKDIEVYDITDLHKRLQSDIKAESKNEFTFLIPTIQNWKTISKRLIELCDDRILYAMGLGHDSYDSATLRQQLAASNLTLNRSVLLVCQNETILAVLARLGACPFANLTGIGDSLWCIPMENQPGTANLRDILNSLLRDDLHNRILRGATDLTFCGHDPSIAGLIPPRKFLMQLIELPRLLDFTEVGDV